MEVTPSLPASDAPLRPPLSPPSSTILEIIEKDESSMTESDQSECCNAVDNLARPPSIFRLRLLEAQFADSTTMSMESNAAAGSASSSYENYDMQVIKVSKSCLLVLR